MHLYIHTYVNRNILITARAAVVIPPQLRPPRRPAERVARA